MSLGRRPSQAEFEQARERHARELATVRFEREMLEERARLEQLREGEGRRRHEEAKQAEHKQWLAEQKRQLVEARVLRVRGSVSASARVGVSVRVRVRGERSP